MACGGKHSSSRLVAAVESPSRLKSSAALSSSRQSRNGASSARTPACACEAMSADLLASTAASQDNEPSLQRRCFSALSDTLF